jgi:hypothetical protein
MSVRRAILTLLLAFSAPAARAQLSSSGEQNVTGQMGVGTLTPRATLDVVTASTDNYGLWVSSQNGSPLLVVDAFGNVGIGAPSLGPLVDVAGSGDDGDIGLQLRSGNSSSTYSSSQIIFAYGASGLYQHSLVTRAVDGQYLGNDIDFLLWNSTANPSALGTQMVLSLQAAPSASTASVHIQPVGTPVYELVVSNGQTTGGGSVMAASVGIHSSRALKTVVATLTDRDADAAYEDVKSLKPARFRYKRRDGAAGPLVRGLIYEDSPASIHDERGQSLAMEARVANMEMALAVANRRIKDLEKKISEAERGGGR